MKFDSVFSKIEKYKQDNPDKKCRVILVYNPRSSKAVQVEREVLEPLKQISGIMLGKYEVKPTNVDDNAASLSMILLDDDIVITAGGDGTATIGLNGVVLSKRDVRFTALPFGNFNDMARTFKRYSGREIYPLEAKINGEHYRFASCYFTIGMFAESTEIFDGDKMRKKLQKKNGATIYSAWQLMLWYFKNKRRRFIPDFSLNGEKKIKQSDYLAVNGLTVAKFMKGNKTIADDKVGFVSVSRKLTSFFRLVGFMFKSVLFKIPGKTSKKDVILFENEAEIEIQAEGEYKRISGVKEIVISKVENPIKIL